MLLIYIGKRSKVLFLKIFISLVFISAVLFILHEDIIFTLHEDSWGPAQKDKALTVNKNSVKVL